MWKVAENSIKDQITGVFDRAAPTYDRVGPRFFSHFGRRLVELANLADGARVLDVATGRGAVLFPALGQVGRDGFVTGIDLSEMMVQETFTQIVSQGITNARVLVRDGEQPAFPTESFDAILCGFGIFFFPNPELALKEYYRMLKPGGLLGISTWGQDDERWSWLAKLPGGSIPEEVRSKIAFNQPNGMTKFLAGAHFEQVRVVNEELDFIYADENEWLDTQWSHGARAILERIPPEAFEAMKARVFSNIQPLKQPDGIHQLFRAFFTFGVKPVVPRM